MRALKEITPRIRVGHYYQFPAWLRESVNRRGYCYAFHLVASGRGRIVIEGETRLLGAGSLVFLRPGELHSFYPDPAAPYATYNLYLELWEPAARDTNAHLAWDEEAYETGYRTTIEPCAELDRCPGVIPLHHETALRELFAHIVRLQADRAAPLAAPILESLLYGWMLNVCASPPAEDPMDPRIRRCLAWIEAHPSSDPREWQAHTGLGKSQFLALFRRSTGLSPHAYREKWLLARAASALLETRRTVTEIAAELGFSSIHYFSKRFRERYGVSPGRYRHRTK